MSCNEDQNATRFLAPPFFNVNVELPPDGSPGDVLVRSQDGSPYALEWARFQQFLGDVGPEGPAGPAGASAYQVALNNGFIGTEAEWLASIEGTDGAAGADGADGFSAYEVAVANGFAGTEAEWLTSLVGPQGPEGPTGPVGPEGPQGEPGFLLADEVAIRRSASATQTLTPATVETVVFGTEQFAVNGISYNATENAVVVPSANRYHLTASVHYLVGGVGGVSRLRLFIEVADTVAGPWTVVAEEDLPDDLPSGEEITTHVSTDWMLPANGVARVRTEHTVTGAGTLETVGPDVACFFSVHRLGGTGTPPEFVPAPFRGALVTLVTDDVLLTASVENPIPLTNVVYEAGLDFYNPAAPTRLTVPNGVAFVRLTGSVKFATPSTRNGVALMKNGTTVFAGGSQNYSAVADDVTVSVATPVIPVTPGDYFELVAITDTSQTLLTSPLTFLSLEAVA